MNQSYIACAFENVSAMDIAPNLSLVELRTLNGLLLQDKAMSNIKAKAMSRYSKKVFAEGIQFDSETEYAFYLKLKQAKKLNQIKDFEVNPTFTLIESFETDFPSQHKNCKEEKMEYIVDYGVLSNDGTKYLLDTKGAGYSSVEVEARNKRKLLLSQNPHMPIYFVSKLPLYLGGEFVCINPKNDFYTKIKGKYTKFNPKKKKGDKTKKVQWSVKDWEKYFEFELKDNLFYIWEKTLKK